MASGTAAWCQASAHGNSSPDVYLITIDTLRADHVGCYGYKQVETPALDALAADGIRFTQAFTHSPITNTSHTTILTGLLPMCATCKRVRNDKGYWEQVEAFIAKHSEVTFTHSICPECSEKYERQFGEG